MSREKVVFQAESVQTVTEDIEDNISETARENSQTENGVYVKGMALPFGKTSRNGVQYERESVKENAEDLIGRPILFNHKQDFSTGHILNIEVTEDGMYYEGDINPKAEMPNGVPVAEAVERGDIRSPSIQAFIEQLGEEADEEAVVQDMQTEKVAVADFIEISMVTVPGFPQATAMPEHLQKQGVKPMAEALGNSHLKTESLDNPRYNVGDFVEWEFGGGSAQGEVIDKKTEPGESLTAGGNEFTIDEPGGDNDVPLYKIQEWDETEGEDGEFTNNVVKFEDELNQKDRPADAPATAPRNESLSKEDFEFAPVPTHVLYEDEEDARLRAEDLGLDDIHEHEMSGETYYMAGENHEEWMEAIERENSTDSNNTEQEDGKRAEPFAGYDDFDECVEENQDKRDPEAYCAAIKRKAEIKARKEALADVDLTPPEAVKNAAQAALDWEEENEDRQDCGTGVGDSRANSITNETLEPEDFLGGENTAIPDYLESHEEDVTAEGTPTDWNEEEMNDCGNRQYAKWGGTGTGTGLEWAQQKEQELLEAKESVKNISEDDNSMSEQEQEDGNTEKENHRLEEAIEDLNERDLLDLVASHYDGVSVDDLGALMEEFEFTGWDARELASVIAQAIDESTGDVLDMLDSGEEGMYGDEDEEDEEEESTENKDSESEDVEEMEREKLVEKVNTLEERLEAILDNEDGTSKQNSPSSEEEEIDLNRRPTFKDSL